VERPDRILFFDPVFVGVALGSDSKSLVNVVYFEGNPTVGTLKKTYTRSASIDEYGSRAYSLDYYALALEEDADKVVNALLDDVAYPEPAAAIRFFHGNASVEVGDIIEVRGEPVRRLERRVPGEWGNRFDGHLVGRVKTVRHRLSGKMVSTVVELTSPLRSVENPLGFILRSQPSASEVFQFRLDDPNVGLDLGYHLD